jgi:hypothetical protein
MRIHWGCCGWWMGKRREIPSERQSMGLFDFLSKPTPCVTEGLVIDLGNFTCGHTRLGASIDPRDFFADALRSTETYHYEPEGLEVGVKSGRLDYLFVTLDKFRGRFELGNQPLSLGSTTTPAAIQQVFHEPYWQESLDDEIIQFYEFESGKIELQFEFPDCRHLEFITLMLDGVLSSPVQRNGYRVNKPWPPT